jgi:molybdopterin converting factor small subunit
MTVQVRLFAMLREAAGTGTCRLTLTAPAQGRDAKAALVAQYPRLRGLVDCARLAVNCEYQAWDARLSDGDELVLIPPVSGG